MGKKIKVNKRKKNVSTGTTSCPNCGSIMKLNSRGTWECSGDRLQNWEKEFIRFFKMKDEEKAKYLTSISNYSRFIELYDRWMFSQEHPEDTFNCGYVNVIFPTSSQVVIRIPDPIFVKKIEHKLGRHLTEEELIGESELWMYGGRILTQWRKKAKQVRIPYVILPSEETIYA